MADPVPPARLASVVTPWIEARLSAAATRQATYAAAHGGRYFQGVRWSIPDAAADVAPDRSLRPHDQDESWADTGWTFPATVPCALAVDVYRGPTGLWGWTLTAYVRANGATWRRTWDGTPAVAVYATGAWLYDVEPVT